MKLDEKLVLEEKSELESKTAQELLFAEKTQKKPKSVSIFDAIEQRRQEDLAEAEQNQAKCEIKPKPQPEKPKSTITSPNFDHITASNTGLEFKAKQKKQKKFRLKLVAIVYAVVLVMCSGWITYSAVEISKANYKVGQYIAHIEQLDNASEVESGESTIITTIIPIEQNQLSEPTKTQPQTNWFDKICNFLSSIFGG